MEKYLFQHSLCTIVTQAVSPWPPQPGKGETKHKTVSLGGGSTVCTHGFVKLDTWIEGWGYGEGMCQVWGIKTKCERQTTERCGKRKPKKSPVKKKNKKRAAAPKNFFFCSDGDTLTRTSEPSQYEPRLVLWTTDRSRFGHESGHGLVKICIYLHGFLPSWQKQLFWGITTGITVLRG